MKTVAIDNSAEADLNRTITWQFDNSPHLYNCIEMLKDFFEQSTEDFWNDMSKRINISDPENVYDYGLAVWGKLLGVPRPTVTITSPSTGSATRKISTELYRRLLVGRLRLAMSNASTDAYIDFVKYVFTDGTNTNVSVTDGRDMSLTFTYTKVSGLTDDDKEQKELIENYPELILAYPSGVRSSDEVDAYVLGFDTQVRPATSGQSVISNQTVGTSVVVTIYGTTGTTIPSGSKFSHTEGGVTYVFSTSEAVTIPSGKVSVEAIFSTSGTCYVKSGEVAAITDSSGSSISGVTSAENVERSHTDFRIGNFDPTLEATFAWNRFNDR